MNDMERSQLIEVLEQARAKLLPGQDGGPDAEWTLLVTGILELPITYLPAVQTAVHQGRWRNAKNPKAYIRRVALREARSMRSGRNPKSTRLTIPANLQNDEGEALSVEQYIDFLCADVGAVKEEGIWKARDPLYEPIFVDDEGREIPCVYGRPVPEDLLMLADDEPDAKLVVNWLLVIERAGLDDEEGDILMMRTSGLSREAILRELAQGDDNERRKWQAAWRRLDRHMDRVRAVFGHPRKKCAQLEKNVLPNVPKTRFPHTV